MQFLQTMMPNWTTAQALAVVALMVLLLLILLAVAVLVLHRRTRQAELQMREMALSVARQIEETETRMASGEAAARKEIGETARAMNDAVMRMMGEMTRTQQGQMDSLGGQLRATGQQEEERIERIRETMDKRLSSYEERLGGVNKTLEEKLAGNEERLTHMRDTLEDALNRLNAENRAQLEQMRQTVDEKLTATVDRRLEASFAAVSDRLEQVTRSLNAMQALTGSMDELSRTLSGAQPLGISGEVQLGALLAQMLAPEQYAQHAAVRPGGEAVADYVVVMPGQGQGHTVLLPLDAGLPMREYQELRAALESGTREQIENARGLLESAVRMHARRMSEKLIAPPYTTDYAVLFLQSEGLFAEVLRTSGLAERIQRESHMVVAGPTTLAALLTSLQMGFRSLAIEQRTEDILALLGAVRTDFERFAGVLSRTQKRLRQASEDIESAQKHSQSIARRLTDVQELPRSRAERVLGTDAQKPDAFDEDEWD